MVNKLAAGALGQGTVKKKSKPAKKVPAPRPAATREPMRDVAAAPRPPKKAGLDPDRYYRAEEALHTLSRAAEHKADKGLMRDVKRVAEHQVKQMNRALGDRDDD